MLNTENAIENRDRHEDTWISVFLCRLFLCANVNVSKGLQGLQKHKKKKNKKKTRVTKGYGIKIMAYSLERLLFVRSTPRRIYTCGRQCLCCNGYSAVSGAEKAGDSSEDPQTGKEKQIYV